MGVENGETQHHPGEQSTVAPQDHLVQTPGPEQDGQQRAEGRSVAVPVTVVTRAELEELQQQLEAAQAKAEKYDRQREKKSARQQRWRENNRDHVNRYARELRARKRGSG
jgi:hypothetical protein